MSRNVLIVVLAGCALAAAVTLTGHAIAQDRGGGPGAGRGGFGGTPEERAARIEEARTRMLEQAREQLGFTEDEWTLVKPRYEKVTELNRDLNMGGMGGMRGMRGGRGGRGGNAGADAATGGGAGRGPGGPGTPSDAEQTQLDKARQSLRETLANEEATTDQIKTALEQYRTSRKKSEQELAQSRTALRELLDVRQEAMLVSQGLLD